MGILSSRPRPVRWHPSIDWYFEETVPWKYSQLPSRGDFGDWGTIIQKAKKSLEDPNFGALLESHYQHTYPHEYLVVKKMTGDQLVRIFMQASLHEKVIPSKEEQIFHLEYLELGQMYVLTLEGDRSGSLYRGTKNCVFAGYSWNHERKKVVACFLVFVGHDKAHQRDFSRVIGFMICVSVGSILKVFRQGEFRFEWEPFPLPHYEAIDNPIQGDLLPLKEQQRLSNYITSPTFGRIELIDKRTGIIRIYLSPEDYHTIFSPSTGKIKALHPLHGQLYPIIDPTYRFRLEFKSNPPRRNVNGQWIVGQLDIVIEHEIHPDITVSLYVGSPPYITDTIRLFFDVLGPVVQGQPLGEIILGSHCELKLPLNTTILIKQGDYVQGLHSKIAAFASTS